MTGKRGRPPLPPEVKPVKVNVKLPAWAVDFYCREALATGESLHARLRLALLRGISGGQKNRRRRKPAHDSPGSPLPGRG